MDNKGELSRVESLKETIRRAKVYQ